ncbi:MAG TPA: cysteine desulfurase family protein [Gemmatales bacterium]|nr:cysteine desulfurase family protein [Gemmatales bacterium]
MSSSRPLYFDYNATTPIDPAVLEAMLPWFMGQFGNPSSGHEYGRQAQGAVAHAREQLAALINAGPEEIIFTSSCTEASNFAIKGWVGPLLRKNHGLGQIITSTIEHPATLIPCQHLAKLGCQITLLPVDGHGTINLDALQDALQRPTALVSIMHANNEVGTLQPIQEIVRLAHQTGALIHCDAAQSIGKVPVDVKALDVDLLSLAGHKCYAPKGVGALYVRKGITLEPLIHGAGQELGRRAGTENVPYVVGFGKAAEIARHSLPLATQRLHQLRDRLWQQLHDKLGDRIVINGHPTQRLPNTLNVSFKGWVGNELLAGIPELATSTGSACHEGHVCVSPVLQAMGIEHSVAQGAVRLSVGRFTTDAEVDRAAELLICRSLRQSA